MMSVSSEGDVLDDWAARTMMSVSSEGDVLDDWAARTMMSVSSEGDVLDDWAARTMMSVSSEGDVLDDWAARTMMSVFVCLLLMMLVWKYGFKLSSLNIIISLKMMRMMRRRTTTTTTRNMMTVMVMVMVVMMCCVSESVGVPRWWLQSSAAETGKCRWWRGIPRNTACTSDVWVDWRQRHQRRLHGRCWW